MLEVEIKNYLPIQIILFSADCVVLECKDIESVTMVIQ